jgi:hypothetical protein
MGRPFDLSIFEEEPRMNADEHGTAKSLKYQSYPCLSAFIRGSSSLSSLMNGLC